MAEEKAVNGLKPKLEEENEIGEEQVEEEETVYEGVEKDVISDDSKDSWQLELDFTLFSFGYDYPLSGLISQKGVNKWLTNGKTHVSKWVFKEF